MYLPHRPCGPQRAASLNLGTPKTDLSLSVAPTRSWRSVCVTITRPSCSRSERLTVRASRRWNRSRSRSCRRCASSWRTRARPCWVRTRSRTWAFLEGLDSCRSSDVKVFFKVEVDEEEEEEKKKGFLLCSVWISAELSDGCSSINLHVMVLTLEPRSHPSLSCYFHYLSLLSFTATERPCVCVCGEAGGAGVRGMPFIFNFQPTFSYNSCSSSVLFFFQTNS